MDDTSSSTNNMSTTKKDKRKEQLVHSVGEEEEATIVAARSSSPVPQQQQQQSTSRPPPIDLSGKFRLVENENFEAFLAVQGVPWALRRAANVARPTHHITHHSYDLITIQICGIIESSTTYEIDSRHPPVPGIVRGRRFSDQVNYMTQAESIYDQQQQQQQQQSNATPSEARKLRTRNMFLLNEREPTPPLHAQRLHE